MSDDDKTVKDLIIQGIDRVDKKVETVAGECTKIAKTQAVMQEAQTHHAESISELHKTQHTMNDILANNTQSLQEHMAQTQILKELTTSVNTRLEPIEQDRLKKQAVKEFMKSAGIKWTKIMGVIATLMGIAYTISKLI